MKFFGRKNKSMEPIAASYCGVSFIFESEFDWWVASVGGYDFISHGRKIDIPHFSEIEQMAFWCQALMHEMKTRISVHLENTKLGADAVMGSINITYWHLEKRLEVSWSEGLGWADLAVDFIIENGQILSETWGD